MIAQGWQTRTTAGPTCSGSMRSRHPLCVESWVTTVVRFALFLCCLALIAPRTGLAAPVTKEAATAWERYLAASEGRIRNELERGPFLFIDGWPEARRAEAYNELRQGTVLIEPVNALEDERPIEVPHGLIPDWQGVVFIPHATLEQTLAVVQNFDQYQEYFKPEIRHSRLLSRRGNDFSISMQLYKKTLITVAIDADFDVQFERLGPNRVADRSCATRLAEVVHVDKADAHELSPDQGDAYLWRLCEFWRFEQKDGGVYAQVESIGLTRSVPAWIAWLVDPLVKSLPRGILMSLLAATRTAVEHG